MNIPNGITYLLDLIKESNIEIRKKEKDLNLISSNFLVNSLPIAIFLFG